MIHLNLTTSGFDAPDPERIIIDGEELPAYSVFSNLIVNAVEASPRGEPVSIRIARPDAVTVVIRNFGAVPREIQGRFFDKYS